MKSEPSRTFIGTVVCVDLVGYSKRSVAQQSSIKAEFNRLLSQVLKPVRAEDRIILDTGDGVAVTFLGDPDQCLTVGLEMRDVLNSHGMKLGAEPGEGPVRIGINLGPLKVAVDVNGRPNIVGDGIVVAERITPFAKPGQVVASRSFHDMVSRLSDEHLAMFHYEGRYADKNAREHEIYVVSDPRRAPTPPVAKAPAPVPAPSSKAQVKDPPPSPSGEPRGGQGPTPAPSKPAQRRPDPLPAAPAARLASGGGPLVAFLRNRVAVGATSLVLLALIFAEAWVLDQRRARTAPADASTTQPAPAKVAAAPSTAATPPKADPAPVPEAARKAEPPKVAVTAPAKAEPPAPEPTPPRAIVPAAKPEAAKPEPPKLDAKPAKAEPPKLDPKGSSKPESVAPAAGSPAAIAAQARERAAEAARAAESKSGPQRKLEEPARTAAFKPPSPQVTAIPAPTAAIPSPTPAPAPPPPEPTPAPPPPVAASAAPTPITRVPVNFPRAAAQQGIESGIVKARLAISADGRVTEVRILSSNPPRVFDREAVRALEEWRFNPGAANRSYEVEIAFKR